MTKVIKNQEAFKKAKLISSIKKAGASRGLAAKVASIVSKAVSKRSQIKSAEIKKLAVKALSKLNKKIAKKYGKYKKRR